MPSLSERILKQRAQNGLLYIQTRDIRGMDAFYFLMPHPGKDAYLQKTMGKEGTCMLTDMGNILYCGYGKAPARQEIPFIENALGLPLAECFPQLAC